MWDIIQQSSSVFLTTQPRSLETTARLNAYWQISYGKNLRKYVFAGTGSRIDWGRREIGRM